MTHNNHSLFPDMYGIFLVAGSNVTLMSAMIKAEALQTLGVLISIVVGLLAIVDFSMKIRWKIQQRKRSKERCTSVDECCNVKQTKEDWQ